jgi:NADH:ubiquinone reductase (non-electrogenic)
MFCTSSIICSLLLPSIVDLLTSGLNARNSSASCVVGAFAPTTIKPKRKSGRGTMIMTSHVLNSNLENVDDEDRSKQPHIVILGGGFGGINTALTLPTLPWAEYSIKPKITVIDKSERFVFLPLLYELCVEDASMDEVAPTFKSLLDGAGSKGIAPLSALIDLPGALQLPSGADKKVENTDECDVTFLQATVEGVDVNTQQVVVSKLDDNEIEFIAYDALVVSTGAEISLDSIPGASEYALPFYTIDQALELKRRLALIDIRLKDTAKPINIAVVGGGYAGVELALNLVDRFGVGNDNVKVSLVHRGKQVLEYATEHNRKTGLDRLEGAGVNVMTATSVEEVLPRQDDESEEMSPLQKHVCEIKLRSTSNASIGAEAVTTSLPTTLLIWTAGATPTSERKKGILNSILPRDVMGRILTSPTLNVPEYANVFAVGDCSRPKKVPFPGTAQVAIQQATVAGWNVFATLTGQGSHVGERGPKLLPFKFLNLGEMMTLGSHDATISTLGGNVELSGPVASWLRRWIYAVRMPTPRQTITAAVDGTGRKLARGVAGRKSKQVFWK